MKPMNDAIESKVDHAFVALEALLEYRIHSTPLRNGLLYYKRCYPETNIFLLNHDIVNAIHLTQTHCPHLHRACAAWQTRRERLQPSYTTIVETAAFHRALRENYAQYRHDFLTSLQDYTLHDAVDEPTRYHLANTLSMRDIIEPLVHECYQGDPAMLAHERDILDTALIQHLPIAYRSTLGSWNDPAYQVLQLIPLSSWWWYRESYAGK